MPKNKDQKPVKRNTVNPPKSRSDSPASKPKSPRTQKREAEAKNARAKAGGKVVAGAADGQTKISQYFGKPGHHPKLTRSDSNAKPGELVDLVCRETMEEADQASASGMSKEKPPVYETSDSDSASDGASSLDSDGDEVNAIVSSQARAPKEREYVCETPMPGKSGDEKEEPDSPESAATEDYERCDTPPYDPADTGPPVIEDDDDTEEIKDPDQSEAKPGELRRWRKVSGSDEDALPSIPLDTEAPDAAPKPRPRMNKPLVDKRKDSPPRDPRKDKPLTGTKMDLHGRDPYSFDEHEQRPIK